MGSFKAIIIIAVAFLLIKLLQVSAKRGLENAKKSWEEKVNRFKNMSPQDRLALSDDELFDMTINSLEQKDCDYDEPGKCFNYLSEAEKNVYVAFDYYESAFAYNSSLRDYFGSEKRNVCVARTSQSLAAIGAYDHQQVFDEFVSKNNINLDDLSGFKSYWDEDYKNSQDEYDYAKVDARLKALPDIKTYIVKYIRENVEFF